MCTSLLLNFNYPIDVCLCDLNVNYCGTILFSVTILHVLFWILNIVKYTFIDKYQIIFFEEINLLAKF